MLNEIDENVGAGPILHPFTVGTFNGQLLNRGLHAKLRDKNDMSCARKMPMIRQYFQALTVRIDGESARLCTVQHCGYQPEQNRNAER